MNALHDLSSTSAVDVVPTDSESASVTGILAVHAIDAPAENAVVPTRRR